MEAPVRIINASTLSRHFFSRTTMAAHSIIFPSNLYRSPLTPLTPQNILVGKRTIAFSRIHALVTPNPNSNLFSSITSLTFSNFFKNPNQTNSFTSNSLKSNPNDTVFSWHRAPQSVDNPEIGFSARNDANVTVVLLGWLGAQKKHLRRYVEWYNARGMHAVTFVVGANELLGFDLGKTVEKRIAGLASELSSWLLERDDNGRERSLVFHAFSNMGWLAYGYIIDVLQREGLVEKVRGFICDSGGGDPLNPKVWAGGFSAAILKKRSPVAKPITHTAETNEPDSQVNPTRFQEEDVPVMETMFLSVLEKLFSVILNLPEVNNKLTKIISTLLKNQPCCPQLYLYSSGDKVVPSSSIESLVEEQRRMGRQVFSFNFESSPHVDHYRCFPDIYLFQVDNYLRECFATVKQC